MYDEIDLMFTMAVSYAVDSYDISPVLLESGLSYMAKTPQVPKYDILTILTAFLFSIY